MKKQTLEQKIIAATFICAMTDTNIGIRTKAQLMHPITEFTDEEVRLEAANFLGSVHTAKLKALPLQDREQILKEQAERLDFVL